MEFLGTHLCQGYIVLSENFGYENGVPGRICADLGTFKNKNQGTNHTSTFSIVIKRLKHNSYTQSKTIVLYVMLTLELSPHFFAFFDRRI